MKLINVVTKAIAIVAVVLAFVSCDDDFNSVGSEIIGDVNFEDKQYIATPIAFSKKIERVQTNNLISSNPGAAASFHAKLLGFYTDPVYGESTYNILSQIQPAQTDFPISFGNNAVLDSVVIDIPYFSTETSRQDVEVEVNGRTVREVAISYSLDSIYGNQPMKLSIFQSDYFLRDFDPSTNNRQIYYSDDVQAFNSIEGDGTPLYTNDAFLPSPSELILVARTLDQSGNDSITGRSRVSPRLRVKLTDEIKDKFQTQFLDQVGSAELSNSNNFLNYFRGIYLKVEKTGGNAGNLVYLDLRDGNISLHYTTDSGGTVDDGDGGTTAERAQRTLELNFSNNVINAIDRTPLDVTPNGLDIETELLPENQDMVNGEDNLYLKGGNGAFVTIDLFNRYIETDSNGNFILDENDNPIFKETPDNPTENDKTELDFLRAQEWLISDASMSIYVNQNAITSGSAEPERIYIFNAETGQTLVDYDADLNVSEIDAVNSRTGHLGRLSKDSDGNGEFYRIRFTQYIINLLNDDSIDNIKLGLSVSQNVNIITSAFGDTPTTEDEIIPTSSINSHEGTILYGNASNVPESKQLKLNISYTAPKNN